LKALQAVTVKNQQNVQLLTSSLERAESERYANPLVYALVALLAGVLAVAAYGFSRTRNSSSAAVPWWGGGDTQPKPVLPPSSATDLGRPSAQVARVAGGEILQKSAATRVAAVAPSPVAPNVIDVDIALGDSAYASLGSQNQNTATKKPPTEVKRADKRDFSASGSAHLRAINTKEMLDVRQQAEFFMALGQHDEAVKVLESSISASAETNPLVYLDLIKLCHTLSRRDDFDRYRDDFNQQFTGVVQGYTAFLTEGNGLETYADICNQIVALWPTDDAIDYIEMCMVRQPHDEPGQGFELDAFRDLLMLHGVLRRLGSEVDSAMVPFSASRLSGGSRLDAISGEAGIAYDEQLDIATASVPILPHAPEDGADSVDLDLATPPANLMDFDVNGLGKAPKQDEPEV
jgi:hypothetical protein